MMPVEPHPAFTVSEPRPAHQTLSWFERSGQFVISLTNDSAAAGTFRLAGADVDGACGVAFPTPEEKAEPAGSLELRLQPGETAAVTARATPPERPLIGLDPRSYPFAVTVTMAEAPEASQSVWGQLDRAPLAGPWVLTILVLCLTGLTWLGFLALVDRLTTAPGGGRAAGALESAAATVAGRSPDPAAYDQLFREIAPEYGLDWQLLAAQAYVESRLDPRAVGRQDEMGLMQILPSTWAEWAPQVGVSDPYDPRSNILVGAAYLAFLRDYFGSLGYAEEHWMLVAYNWGPYNLQQFIEQGQGWAQVPARQRRYVLSILRRTGGEPPQP